jgi:hypothetical protein
MIYGKLWLVVKRYLEGKAPAATAMAETPDKMASLAPPVAKP